MPVSQLSQTMRDQFVQPTPKDTERKQAVEAMILRGEKHRQRQIYNESLSLLHMASIPCSESKETRP